MIFGDIQEATAKEVNEQLNIGFSFDRWLIRNIRHFLCIAKPMYDSVYHGNCPAISLMLLKIKELS